MGDFEDGNSLIRAQFFYTGFASPSLWELQSYWPSNFENDLTPEKLKSGPTGLSGAALQIKTAPLQSMYSQMAVIKLKLQSTAVHSQWQQWLQPKFGKSQSFS